MRRIIAAYLLILLLGIIVEKTIPHSHVEHDGFAVPDFTHNDNNSHSDNSENGEELHSTFYQPEISDNTIDCKVSILLFFSTAIFLNADDNPIANNYNILPKILNSILASIHFYSAKAPPFFS